MRKLYATYALAALAPVALFVLIQIPLVWHWHSIHQAQQQRTQIKEEVLRLQALTADIENGFRGYVLTKQSAFLHPVVHGEAKVQGVLDHLMDLTKDLPNLLARVKVLQERIHELIDTKRRLTKQMDSGEQEAVMSYIRFGDGLALSKTIEKAMEDFEVRIEGEFSRFDMEETTLKERMLQKLLIAAAGMFVLGILITRLIFRAANEKTSLAPSK
ncbi:MAG: CHASE3 domain-containing protein [Nitrospiraceae bacterium]